MSKPNTDIFASDSAFIAFGAAMLSGIGLAMLAMGLLCKWSPGFSLCGIRFITFPLLEWEWQVVSRDFIAINLPLGMLIIGVGLQLFNRLGWFVSLFLLTIFIALFAASFTGHFPRWQAEGNAYAYLRPMLLNGCILILLVVSFVYLFLPPVRRLYWKLWNEEGIKG